MQRADENPTSASGPCVGLDRREALGDEVEGLVPGGRHELAVAAHERLREPVGVRDELVAVAALDAQVALAGALADQGRDLDDAAVVDLQLDVAAAAAEGADGVDRRGGAGLGLDAAELVHERPGGARGDAVAAHLAVGLDHGAPERGGDQRVEAALARSRGRCTAGLRGTPTRSARRGCSGWGRRR